MRKGKNPITIEPMTLLLLGAVGYLLWKQMGSAQAAPASTPSIPTMALQVTPSMPTAAEIAQYNQQQAQQAQQQAQQAQQQTQQPVYGQGATYGPPSPSSAQQAAPQSVSLLDTAYQQPSITIAGFSGRRRRR